MSTTPFLKYAAFDQDDINAMSIALDEVCSELQIGADNSAREVVECASLNWRSVASFSRRNQSMKNAGIDIVTLPGSDERVALHFHDLRGTTVTLLSEAGCSVPQIATITGHSLKTVDQILEQYLARTKGLAEQAIANFENSPRTKFANQLQTQAIDVRPGKSLLVKPSGYWRA